MPAANSEPRTRIIVISSLVTILLLVVVCVALISVYDHYFRKYDRLRGNSPNLMRATVENEESLRLHGRAELDRATGRIRIPVERAIELEAQRPWRPNTPRLQPTVTPAPLDAAGHWSVAAEATATTPTATTDATTATLREETGDAAH
jgi:hypothetical protein